MTDSPNTVEAIIPAGQSESQAIDLGQFIAHRLEMPDDGWTAAAITLRVSRNGEDYDDVFVETGEYQLTSAAAGRAIILDPAIMIGVRRLIVRSGTSGAPVNQAAERRVCVVKVSG
ncbi:MAG: hypothetical protein AB1942_21145 [Pseudomonadota bacterium]